MESCEYKEIDGATTDHDSNSKVTKVQWKYFCRQVMIASGFWTIYFVDGMLFGGPAVIIPQLRREANSTQAVTDDMASWLSSVFGLSGLPWVFLMSILLEIGGRRITLILISINLGVGYIIIYFSTTVNHLLIGEIVLGILLTTSQLMPVLISEYTSPKHRGFFLTMKSTSFAWGMWVANAIGTFFHWKNIAVLALVCCLYLVTVLFWPESPFWLASKGRFEECRKSHRWIKGYDQESEEELKNLIHRHQNNVEKISAFRIKRVWVSFLKNFSQPEFKKILLIGTLLITHYYTCGKIVVSMYAIVIVKKITNSEAKAYSAMLIMDGVTVFSMFIGSILTKFFKRRVLLILFSCIGAGFLLMLSLYLYLVRVNLLVENGVISIMLLVLYSIAISLGPYILCTSVYGELVPTRFIGTFFVIIAFVASGNATFHLKVAPMMFKNITLHGTFLLYGVASMFTTFLLFRFMPETKDKTLQEIEEYFKDKKLLDRYR